MKLKSCTGKTIEPWPVLLDHYTPSAIYELLFELEKAGFNVQAACFELQAHRHHLEITEQKLEALAKLTKNYTREAQHYLGHH